MPCTGKFKVSLSTLKLTYNSKYITDLSLVVLASLCLTLFTRIYCECVLTYTNFPSNSTPVLTRHYYFWPAYLQLHHKGSKQQHRKSPAALSCLPIGKATETVHLKSRAGFKSCSCRVLSSLTSAPVAQLGWGCSTPSACRTSGTRLGTGWRGPPVQQAATPPGRPSCCPPGAAEERASAGPCFAAIGLNRLHPIVTLELPIISKSERKTCLIYFTLFC